jgi:CsoR family transcriptional regulator, copper-sensing transcriptional repressor
MSNDATNSKQVLEAQSAGESPDRVLVQLRRIRGQVDGIVKMYEDERMCVDIVRQVMAVRHSLSRVARDLLTNEASRCNKKRDIEELDAILKEALKY